MTYVRSYTRVERELMHQYRDQLNHAESEEDIKKFFAQTIQSLLNKVMDSGISIQDNDAALNPESSPYYRLSQRLVQSDAFRELKQYSDITAVLKRFAEPAAKHCHHLRGHPEKTEAKIRHHQ